MSDIKKLLLWALENLEKEPMCEDPEVLGHCDFKFEAEDKCLCPCEWRSLLKSELLTK